MRAPAKKSVSSPHGKIYGYLVIFEKKSSEELPWEVRIRREEQEVEGRRISVLWL